MVQQSFDNGAIRELRETAEAAEALAKNPEVFEEAVEAYRARDASRQARCLHPILVRV